MSNRISNSRNNQFEKGKARSRVRYGWRKRRIIAMRWELERQRRLAPKEVSGADIL